MVDAAKALAGMTDQSPATQLAPMANAAAPSPFAAALADPKIFMALISGGLGSIGSNNVGKGFQQGFGTYQQLLQNERDLANRAFDEEMALEGLGLKKEGLELDKEGLELKKRQAKALEKANQLKKKPVPTGVDKDLWKQALDTAVAQAEAGEPIDESYVRELYNSMAPENRKVPELFGRKHLNETLTLIEQRPELRDSYLELLETRYGKAARTRVTAVLDKMEAAAQTEEEKGGKSPLSNSPPLTSGATATGPVTAEATGGSMRPVDTSQLTLPSWLTIESGTKDVFGNPIQRLNIPYKGFSKEGIYNNYPFTTLGKPAGK